IILQLLARGPCARAFALRPCEPSALWWRRARPLARRSSYSSSLAGLCARLRAAALRAVRTLVAARAPARSSIILQLLARGPCARAFALRPCEPSALWWRRARPLARRSCPGYRREARRRQKAGVEAR